MPRAPIRSLLARVPSIAPFSTLTVVCAPYPRAQCYMQAKGSKYVRMYSQSYKLLTTGIEGSCVLDEADDQYYCGLNPGTANGCIMSCTAPLNNL